MARGKFKVEVIGLKELRDQFKNVAPKEANEAAADTVYEIAGVVEGRLFRRLREKSRTGRLAFSTFRRRRPTRDGIVEAEVRGGATAPYLLIREFGTVHMPAAPAIGPATEETRPEVPTLMREHFGKRLEQRLRKK